MRFGRLFFILIIMICAVEFMRLWNIAPPEMAAHFDAPGNPDRFVPKTEFFWLQARTLLLLLGVSVLPQILFLVLPVQFINMPNREHWLAPERRDETISRLSSFGALLFGIILLVTQAGFELAVYANLQTPILFNAQWMMGIMLVSFVVLGLLLFQLIVSFRRPDTV